jgi:hypothetical protein
MMLELELDGLGSLKMDMAPDEVETGKMFICHTVERLGP